MKNNHNQLDYLIISERRKNEKINIDFERAKDINSCKCIACVFSETQRKVEIDNDNKEKLVLDEIVSFT